jgi:hypothetical protein
MSELDSEGNIKVNTAIYTYRLLDDYRATKLEIIPEVVGPRPPTKIMFNCFLNKVAQEVHICLFLLSVFQSFTVSKSDMN